MRTKYLLITGLFIAIIIAIAGFVSGDLEQREHSVAEGFFKEAVYHFNQQEFMASSAALIRALSNDPAYYKARYWLGKTYYRSGYIKNALEEWERALSLIGDDPLLSNKMSRLLYQLVDQTELNGNEKFVTTDGLGYSNSSLKNPSSVYVDNSKLYWVVGYGSNNVVIFNKNGKEVDQITKAKEVFKNPYDVVVNSKGEIFISEFGRDQIHKYDAQRNYLFSFGRSGLNDKEFYGPQGLALDKQDNLFVVDSGNHRIQKFDKDGNFLLKFGKAGAPEGKEVNLEGMLNPCDIVLNEDKIYVTDTGNKRIQVYDLNGNWIESIGENFFLEPKGIKKIKSSNEFLVADSKLGIVKVILNPLEIKILKKLDDKDKGDKRELTRPLDMALDDNNFLYIADLNQSYVLAFVPEKLKYNNLEVNILQTRLDSENAENGDIVHRVEVKDQVGKPIMGLSSDNFISYEENVSHKISVTPEITTKKGSSLVVINEKTQLMKPHAQILEKIIRPLMKSFTSFDQIEVINFSYDNWLAQPFINNELSPLYAIMENRYDEVLTNHFSAYSTKESNDSNEINSREESSQDSQKNGSEEEKKMQMSVGEAFYKGVSDVLSDQSKVGAILLITSGKLNEKAFMPYGYEVCLNYARSNHIPVYIFSFSDDEMKDELVQMAERTGGKYFNVNTSQDIYKLPEYIQQSKQGVYYVQYKSKLAPSRNFKWREVKVEVRLKDLFGQDQSGYYIR